MSPSSSSTDQSQGACVVSELADTTVHPSDDNETIEIASVVARAAVHAPTAFEGPDALLLCSADGLRDTDPGDELTPSDFSFYQTVPISGTSGDPQLVIREDKMLKVIFVPEENEGTLDVPASKAKSALESRSFSLFWAPTGDPNEERIMIAEDVSGGTAWTEEEEVERFMAHFVTTKFAEACEAALPGETPPAYDPEDPIRKEAPPLDFLEDDDEDETSRKAHRHAEPMWESATPVESRSGTGGDGSFERPPGPRWVHLIQTGDLLGDAADEEAPDYRVLGAYKVTEDGEYKRARFTDQGTLEVIGDAQAKVIVPIDGGGFSTKRHITYARLSGFKVSEWRLNDLGKRIAGAERPRDQQAALMPLRVTAATLTDGQADGGWGRHATNYDSVFAGACSDREDVETPLKQEPFWMLPHPLSIAERRVGAAEQAFDRLQAWTETVGDAPALTGPMRNTCYNEDQQRTYLADRLRAVDGAAHDMTDASNWGEFSHDAVPSAPEGESALAHFQYGAQCQEAYLRRQWRRATQAFDRLAEGGLLTHDVVLDALTSERAADGEAAQVERLFAFFVRMQAVGGGTALPSMMRESELLKHMGDCSLEEGTEMPAPLDEAVETSLPDDQGSIIRGPNFVRGSGFKLLFKLAQESTKTAQHLFAQGTATAAVTWSTSTVLVESYAKAPPKSFVVWGWLVQRMTDYETSPSEVYDYTKGSVEASGAGGRVTIGATQITRTSGSHRAIPWKISVNLDVEAATERWMGQSTSARLSSSTLGTASTAAGGIFSVLDVLLGTYTLWADSQEGALDMTDGARMAKVVAGVAGSVDAGAELSGSFKTMMKELVESGAARRVGRFLARTMPTYLEAVTMGIHTWEQYNDVDHRGLQTISDPNYIGSFGAVVKGTGGIVAGGAAWAGAWPFVAAGAAAYAGGQILMWVDENLDEIEAELNDPLTNWLPTDTLWGEDAGADYEPFFQLVRPGDPTEKKALAEYNDPSA